MWGVAVKGCDDIWHDIAIGRAYDDIQAMRSAEAALLEIIKEVVE